MPLFLDGPGAERTKRVADIVLGGPRNVLPTPTIEPERGGVRRGVLVTGPAEAGYFPGKLQYRDSEDEAWADLTDTAGNAIEVWAIAYSGSALEEDERYGGDLVSFHEGKAVYAVTAGGGAAFSGALVYGQNNQIIEPAVNGEPLTFPTGEIFDTDGYFDTGDNTKFTIPETGKYLIHCVCHINIASATGNRSLVPRVNGAQTVPATYHTLINSNVGIYTMENLQVKSLAAGDYVEWHAASGNALADATASLRHMLIIRLDPPSTGGGGSGTVTSVAMTVPTGLTVAGSPITSAGTLALGWAGGDSWIDEVDGGTV